VACFSGPASGADIGKSFTRMFERAHIRARRRERAPPTLVDGGNLLAVEVARCRVFDPLDKLGIAHPVNAPERVSDDGMFGVLLAQSVKVHKWAFMLSPARLRAGDRVRGG